MNKFYLPPWRVFMRAYGISFHLVGKKTGPSPFTAQTPLSIHTHTHTPMEEEGATGVECAGSGVRPVSVPVSAPGPVPISVPDFTVYEGPVEVKFTEFWQTAACHDPELRRDVLRRFGANVVKHFGAHGVHRDDLCDDADHFFVNADFGLVGCAVRGRGCASYIGSWCVRTNDRLVPKDATLYRIWGEVFVDVADALLRWMERCPSVRVCLQKLHFISTFVNALDKASAMTWVMMVQEKGGGVDAPVGAAAVWAKALGLWLRLHKVIDHVASRPQTCALQSVLCASYGWAPCLHMDPRSCSSRRECSADTLGVQLGKLGRWCELERFSDDQLEKKIAELTSLGKTVCATCALSVFTDAGRTCWHDGSRKAWTDLVTVLDVDLDALRTDLGGKGKGNLLFALTKDGILSGTSYEGPLWSLWHLVWDEVV